MNYLLVVPRIVDKPGDFYLFPQGIAYISSAMMDAGLNPFKLNLNHIDGSVEEIIAEFIKNHSIDVVLTGGLTGQYGAIKNIIDASKRYNPSIINIVGGGIITSAPHDSMRALENADYGVIGEGEIIVCELCRALEENKPVMNIAGIIYKTNIDYSISNGIPAPVDVNKLSIPDFEGMGMDLLLEKVPNVIGISDYNTFPIITSRGCPFKCTFCFHPSGKYRSRKLDHVFAEIDYLVEKYDVKYLAVQDEWFGHNRKRIKAFCDRIKQYNIRWFAQFRVTDISEELVSMLKDANCATIGFGIESADDRILKSMKKNITVADTNKALELVYKAGIGIQGCLIFGDIAETLETASNSINWWLDHVEYGLQLHVVNAWPGTSIFEYALRNGLIKDTVQFIKDSCPTVRLSKMSDDEYAWMLEQILTLQRATGSLPAEVHSLNVDFKSATMDIAGKCTSCQSENYWTQIRLFIAESLACKQCGRRHYSPIPRQIADRVSENINKLQKEFGKVCFWGVNSYFYEFSKMLSIDNSNVICVDKSDIR